MAGGARSQGLGPTSGSGGQSSPTVGATVRLGKLIGGSAEANALIALVVLEIVAQGFLRTMFKRAHGG